MRKKHKIHMVGVGGIGMSGIAEILVRSGYAVSGSDLKANDETRKLESLGCTIHTAPHREENMDRDVTTVVYSSAISHNNPEILEAKKRKLILMPRAEMLAELMRKKQTVVVAGSHGKTTTSAMVTTLMMSSGLDPTSVIGGKLKSISGNAKIGSGDWFVAESDESDGSFVKLMPTLAIVTNIDQEHMNHYQTYDKLERAFIEFCNHVPFDGHIMICGDHQGTKAILPKIEKAYTTYGLTAESGVYAKNLQMSAEGSSYELFVQNQKIANIRLRVLGEHNVYNSLAACAVGYFLGLSAAELEKGLYAYEGIGRRLEYKGQSRSGLYVYDDYAHHPSEIKATLSALRLVAKDRKINVVFQPHRYSRFGDLWTDFLQSFNDVKLFVLPVYAAGEKPVEGVNSAAFVKAMCDRGVAAYEIENTLEGVEKIKKNINSNEWLVCMGAGDITRLSEEFLL